MIVEKIDLYRYFNRERGACTGGYLTTFVRSKNPETLSRVRPALLVIPGGGYEKVSWREGEPIAVRFLNEGYSAFCLEYTVKTAFPVPLIEAAMAMAYIRKNADRYSVDCAHVAALGSSAGGHLAGMLATLFACEEVVKDLPADADKIRPDAAIFCYPVVSTAAEIAHEGSARIISGEDEKMKERLSVDLCVDQNSAPAFIWHTVDDDCVPVENAFALASAYKKAGVPFALHVFESGHHGLSVGDAETEIACNEESCNKEVQAWLPLAFEWLKKRGFRLK